VCLQAVYIHVLRDGWGPYPRLRNEILGQDRLAAPSPDGATNSLAEVTSTSAGRSSEKQN
jgi:hypothetical protein